MQYASSVSLKVAQLYQNLDVSIKYLVATYIQILTKLTHFDRTEGVFIFNGTTVVTYY
jgi:hypothetical protein